MSNKDGGPAFPVPEYVYDSHAGLRQFSDAIGMTLRDYFAAKAIVTAPHNLHDCDLNAEWAYRMADAMLAAREAKP